MARDAAQEQLHMRIRAADLARIDEAAEAVGVTRSAFVLTAALERADAVILDRVVQAWPAEAVAAFRAVLDAAPAPEADALAAAGRAKPWDRA